MSRSRRVSCLVVALSLVSATASPVAHAQNQAALAEQLFAQGQRLLEAGKITEACEALASSQKLEPAAGTLINLAFCHEQEGRTATAWSEYNEVAAESARAGERDRERFAREHGAAVAKRFSRLVVEVAGKVEGVRVTIDGSPLPSSVLGASGVAVDPGPHAIEVSAPGKKPWSEAALKVPPGPATKRVQVTLQSADASSSDGAASSADEGASSGNKTLAYVVGGTGIVAVGVGIGLLVRAYAFDQKSKSEAEKANLFSPPDPTFEKASKDNHAAAVAHQTAGFIVGGVGLAAVGVGTYFLLRPAPSTKTGRSWTLAPIVGASHTGLEAVGVF